MTQFNNVSISSVASIYFDGQVTSRKVTFADGSTKTLGIMMPGEYTFATAEKELMEIQQGTLSVLLPGSDTWQTITANQAFNVPANASFDVKVSELTDYCCSYIAE
ncbi:MULTISPECIES: pyrimidine/purine nucleoside phosphorylase [unclassified Colwellia]|uniref:pyrimidine/purine nucleoside phosphorylase n=1 Tax=unclassified Colwellia TaxID=196834 RepID=UPI0015F531B1|nr:MULTISPECIES: pyrimidine/purine nucleoside phosphorylase [unclassified Colwellia]MBA6225671.1 pyrimidine/purine nucleoside phosphorylase [Colwellia sp. MB3u-45]MBA6266919.1 pyrimidine/purine nucleoside phosphorylase [Colwellia sp. MB3u-43]MBA6290585.1 pyrimidine/purine nucleoside phosphorylase [Colwellia sp. MB3u-4]MBA6295437.1 pyrimidine/purine nucleoside phosphorylase [Colwellia sp. MB02u-9]MBA6321831.1 pyrimidine/purine nucleoside phosphorylase [Colwellia sp. MB02u-19]